MGFQPRTEGRTIRAALGVWAAVVLVAGSSLMASHLAALPTPTKVDPLLAAEVVRDPDSHGHWTMLHVLAAGCECSRYLLEHLERRGPKAGVHERILWVSSSGKAPARVPAGYPLEVVKPALLRERVGIVGAPTLV